MWHLETDIFAILLMGILIAKDSWQKNKSDQDRMILTMLWVSEAVTLIDLVSSYVMNGHGGRTVYILILTLYYATATVMPCLWMLYAYILIDGGHFKMTPYRFIIIVLPQLIMTLLALTNPWTDLFFSLSEAGEYARGPMFTPFSYFYLIYYPVIGLFTVFRYRKKIGSRANLVVLTLFFLIVPFATQLQLMFPGTLLISISFAVIFVIDDLTIEADRRDELNQQLRERNAQLEEAVQAAETANRAKGEFLSRISHDIRTPIGAILNLTDFAREDLGDGEKLGNDIDKIATSGRFLLSLINDVLDISKIDSGKIELKYEPYRYADYLDEIRNIFLPMCEEKNLTGEVKEGESAFAIMQTDRVRVNQITLNILSNAVKYTPSGGRVRFASSLRASEEGGGLLHIEVEDTGIGMSREFQKVMFDEFAQEKNNPLRENVMTGTGLGLPIVRKLVTLMGGTIDIRSDLGEGTTVSIDLPVARAEENLPAGERAAQAQELLHKRILMAEDNEINVEIALRIFESMGVEVYHAPNGREAVTLFEASEPGFFDAVFMDIQMPVMNGYEAAAGIRALRRADAQAVPIIAMTADAYSEAREKAAGAGMTGFVTKPLRMEELRSCLAEL